MYIRRFGAGHGALAQLVERFVRNEKVRGSIPLSSTVGTPVFGPGCFSLSWCPGVLVSWCPGVLVSWCPGVLVSGGSRGRRVRDGGNENPCSQGSHGLLKPPSLGPSTLGHPGLVSPGPLIAVLPRVDRQPGPSSLSGPPSPAGPGSGAGSGPGEHAFPLFVRSCGWCDHIGPTRLQRVGTRVAQGGIPRSFSDGRPGAFRGGRAGLTGRLGLSCGSGGPT